MRYPALAPDPGFKRDLVLFFSIAAVFYLLSAVFSTTFVHPDQHFQTLEWADFKRTGTNEALLPWEYHYAIRPWIHPYLYFVLLNALDFVGITGPFNQDRVLRILTGAFGMWAVILFCRTIAWWLPLPGQKRTVAAVFALVWLFPNFFTRLSSETMATSFFLLSISALFLLRKDPIAVEVGDRMAPPFTGRMTFSTEGLLLSAACLGLVFHFRYQMGPIMVALAFWMLVAARTPIWQMVQYCTMVLVVVALGIGVDFVGYGGYELAPWNNIKANVIDGVAASFGTSPWYYYFVTPLTSPMGIALVVSLIWFWIKYPRNLLTLLTALFMLQHSLIGHKELRFILPILPLALAMFVFLLPAGWYGEKGTANPLRKRPVWLLILAWILIVANFGGLIGQTLFPLKSEVAVHKFILSREPEHFEFYSFGASPYLWVEDHLGEYRIRMEFYRPEKVTHHIVENPAELEAAIAQHGPVYFLFDKDDRIKASQWSNLETLCTPIYHSFGPLMKQINFNDWQQWERQFSIFECQAANS